MLAAAALTLGHVADPRADRRRSCRWGSASGHTIGFSDLALVSVGGGALASLPVLAATLGLAAGAVRYGWDLDNVTAPLVSTLGDVLTLPALYLATGLLGLGLVTTEPRLGAGRASPSPRWCSAPAPTSPSSGASSAPRSRCCCSRGW